MNNSYVEGTRVLIWGQIVDTSCICKGVKAVIRRTGITGSHCGDTEVELLEEIRSPSGGLRASRNARYTVYRGQLTRIKPAEDADVPNEYFEIVDENGDVPETTHDRSVRDGWDMSPGKQVRHYKLVGVQRY